jgi:hypothetical protein
MEYSGLKVDVDLFLFFALCRPYKKQISFHQTQYSNTPIFQYSMAFSYGIANLL